MTTEIESSLCIKNNGPLIEATNYWDLHPAQLGKLLLSVNAGTFRLLLPPSWENQLGDMTRNVSHVVVSRTESVPTPGAFFLELVFEDGSDSPYSIHLSGGQVIPMPAKSDHKRRCGFAIYVNNGGLQRVFESTAFFQVVPRLPWLKGINPRHFHPAPVAPAAEGDATAFAPGAAPRPGGAPSHGNSTQSAQQLGDARVYLTGPITDLSANPDFIILAFAINHYVTTADVNGGAVARVDDSGMMRISIPVDEKVPLDFDGVGRLAARLRAIQPDLEKLKLPVALQRLDISHKRFQIHTLNVPNDPTAWRVLAGLLTTTRYPVAWGASKAAVEVSFQLNPVFGQCLKMAEVDALKKLDDAGKDAL